MNTSVTLNSINAIDVTRVTRECPLVHWSIGPLVLWSFGPLVECQMSKIKCQRLNFCWSVPPEHLRSFLPLMSSWINAHQFKYLLFFVRESKLCTGWCWQREMRGQMFCRSGSGRCEPGHIMQRGLLPGCSTARIEICIFCCNPACFYFGSQQSWIHLKPQIFWNTSAVPVL